MTNFLTRGRVALVDALKADATLADAVRTWRDHGPGLRQNRALEPAACPLCSVTPLQGDERQAFNVLREIPQRLQVRLATASQNVAACEELVAAAIQVVQAQREGALGLSDAGLQTLDVTGLTWETHEGAPPARVIWTATLSVALIWIR